MSWEVEKPVRCLDTLPSNWDGFTREKKVQRQLDVILEQLKMVREGTFDVSNGDRVSALVLECQFALADFYSDVEASSKSAKHYADYIEAEVCNKIAKEAEKKPSEVAIKRKALVCDEVKESKSEVVSHEKNYKKWRCVYEILREAHITFRNISKL